MKLNCGVEVCVDLDSPFGRYSWTTFFNITGVRGRHCTHCHQIPKYLRTSGLVSIKENGVHSFVVNKILGDLVVGPDIGNIIFGYFQDLEFTTVIRWILDMCVPFEKWFLRSFRVEKHPFRVIRRGSNSLCSTYVCKGPQ